MGRGGCGYSVVDVWPKWRAKHPGAEPDPLRVRRWQVRAWCPITQRHRSRNVLDHELPDAKAWAAKTNRRLTDGLETTGRMPLEKAGAEYVEELRARGVRDVHWQEVERVVGEAVGAGVTDLKAPALAARVRQWLQSLQADDRDLAPETRNRYLGHLKAVTRHAVLAGRLPRDPLAVVKRPRLPKKARRTLTVEELRKLVAPGDEGDDLAATWLWSALMAYGGLRAAEAMNLRWQAIDWQGKRMRVVGKGAKHRAVPIQAELADLLRPRAQLAGFVLSGFRGLSYPARRRWFTKLLRARGIDTVRRSPHALRHTWVALMLASGENAHQVTEWAGHENGRTTEGYARTQGEYRDAVAGWERGQFRLQPVAPAAPADPVAKAAGGAP